MPRSLLPQSLVPFNELYAHVVRTKHMTDPFLYLEADSWENQLTMYQDAGDFSYDAINLRFLPLHETQLHYLVSDGSLLRMIEGLHGQGTA